ncbi:conserved Plasmodium protein, unknown function [Plasmodium gallinaceum]|uniref:Uncharacterized protein n=1 Tax=Plasmodium gallinaceum TaxID=5849 RepID=A0A1J1GZ87_PLAGA|nr:conserved Plasmodium protein, unknown function [Plasmodium gallinaceum]CRG97908.1 conserved Plasmodium protein, unknown function [Plasmodium gallinaceum]
MFWIFFLFFFFLNKKVNNENDISVKGSLTVSNLKISSKDKRESGILFMNDEMEYKLGLNTKNELIISKKNKPLINIDEHDNLNFFNPDLTVKSLNVHGVFKILNINQFQMIVHEDFSNSSNTKGWIGENFDSFTSICGGINLLGGYGKLSKGKIYKIFENIPTHTQVRIKSNFHFIDNWNNQTAYMKIGRDEKEEFFFVWTDSHSQLNKENSINICGNSTGESKFFSLIDIIVPHNSKKLIVEFGTNIQNHEPNNISWGISNFQIYII